MASYEHAKAYDRVLWLVWGLVLGFKVKEGYFVGFGRKIGKRRRWRVRGVGGEGKMTNVSHLLDTTKYTMFLSALKKSVLHTRASTGSF